MTEATAATESHRMTVLDVPVDALTIESATDSIITAAKNNQSGYVCLYNVHSSITATSDTNLAYALRTATLTLPDGAPIAWMLRRKGLSFARRVAGPDLMAAVCAQAATEKIPVFLFGSTEETLDVLRTHLTRIHPGLYVCGTLSPEFGPWSHSDEAAYVKQINDSRAPLIFVGLGCPKQEIWMAQATSNIDGIMLGVGAAFDFHSGKIARAPKIFQSLGLEWFHRLISEPRRLFARYAMTNTAFLLRAAVELFRFHSQRTENH